MTIIQRNPSILENLKKLEPYFKEELNVKEIHYSSQEDHYIHISAKANFSTLGPRLGAKMKTVATQIQQLKLTDLLKLESGHSLLVENESLFLTDVEIRRVQKANHPHLMVHQLVSIEMDPRVTEEQKQEGLTREIIRKIQIARKKADFILDDRIKIQIHCGERLRAAAERHCSLIQRETLCTHFEWSEFPQGSYLETTTIEGEFLQLGLTVHPA